MKKIGLVNEKELALQDKMKENSQGVLNYPLASLKKSPIEKPLNIVLLVIDSWRFDALSEKYSPNLWKLSQKGLVFKNHLSSGNCTRTGIFGLFYALPGTYWHSFLSQRRSPVLMDRLQELEYQMGIFASAHLDMPEFKDTVFAKIPNLRVRSKGAGKVERDIEMTDAWLEWNKNKDKNKPSFSFLFYDAPHGYTFPENYPHKFEPLAESMNYLEFNNDFDPTPLLNRYYTSVHFTDSQAARILNVIEASGEMSNTLFILTGDHSNELNDNKLNFWGHNGNFTDAQIKVPFVIIDPTLKSKDNPWNDLNAMTSHEDLAPTLLKRHLGIRNNIKDYTTGLNLYDKAVKRDWVISSSYNEYAIIDEDSILEVFAFGGYQYMDRRNHPKKGQPNKQILLKAFEAMRRFIR
jgi:membrane-anchored protein YejM (alkaline phosphatase superfamily)